tara:strand:+ start:10382 stop:11089 length:708 start_codon:yes stop_codon:yes gene_type:complete
LTNAVGHTTLWDESTLNINSAAPPVFDCLCRCGNINKVLQCVNLEPGANLNKKHSKFSSLACWVLFALVGVTEYCPPEIAGDSRMRERLVASLKEAQKARDARRVGTIRLILAAVKDRDIANRGAGKDPVGDEDIMQILGKMIKQREESARIFEEAARLELSQQEREEIDVIRSFLPEQLSDDDVNQACRKVVQQTGAQGLRDMGKCMNALKTEYPGQMDFSKASGVVKTILHHD